VRAAALSLSATHYLLSSADRGESRAPDHAELVEQFEAPGERASAWEAAPLAMHDAG
jgi:hypothetical protein